MLVTISSGRPSSIPLRQEAQLSLTNCATLFCKVVEVALLGALVVFWHLRHPNLYFLDRQIDRLQDFLSENVDKKFTTDYNVA